MVVSNNPEIDYMILLGSYNIKEIETTKTLIISAQFDIQMDLEVYEESVQDITNLTEIMIDGGNHAFFGFYGNQRGDGEAEFPNVVQQDIVISLINNYLENN
jgi:hypothetical protein